MQTNEILSASLIDIIFDGRNKDYGAYELRKNYSDRIGRAMLIMSLVTALVFGGVLLGNNSKHQNRYIFKEGTTITEIKDDKKPKMPEPEKPKPKEQQVKEVKNTTIEIVNKRTVDPPHTQDEIKTAITGTIDRPGMNIDSIDGPPHQDPDGGKGIVNLPKKPEGEDFGPVEVDAKYPGNWKAFLERNLNPDVPVSNGAPEGTYSVMIQFVVDREGNVSDLKALTAHGYGMEEEALRVLRKATKWEPAIQNGVKVKAYRRQVITFQVLEG